jgi:hypothetical protein
MVLLLLLLLLRMTMPQILAAWHMLASVAASGCHAVLLLLSHALPPGACTAPLYNMLPNMQTCCCCYC